MLPATLIVEDEKTLAKNICTYLVQNGCEARTAASAAEAEKALESFRPEVILLDYHLPDMDGITLLERIKARDPQVRVVMLTAEDRLPIAVKAIKAGAYDYLSKPLELKEIKLMLERAAGQERLESTLDYYRRKESADSGLSSLIGESEAMLALKARIRSLLDAESQLQNGTPPTVLIIGETGTGKELVARAIHFEGGRRDGAFVEVNCSAIPAHLLEAELFGYEKGAFTDAKERKPGLVEMADGGTLFLDEIGDIEPSVQTKLLKLLEDRRVRRLGGLRDREVDVRILAATNCPLEQWVQEGKFRSDLYFRLRVIQLALPPLRERGDDIMLLARYLLRELSHRYRKGDLHLSESAQEALLQYGWPGNVRELKNMLEHTVLLTPGPIIERSYLPFAPELAPSTSTRSITDSIFTDTIDDDESSLDLVAMERQTIARALEKTRWNVTRAAELLGLSRDTLRYRIQKFQLRSPQ